MKRMPITELAGVAILFALPGFAAAADLSLGGWSFRFDAQARVGLSVPLINEGLTDSGPILVRLWATTDPRSSTTLSEDRYLLAETTVTDGLAAGTEIEVNTSPTDPPESPPDGVYNIALLVEEQGADPGPSLLSFAGSPVDFPLPTAPTAGEIRSRIAGQVPCGALFVQASLASLVGLVGLKWHHRAGHRARRRRRR
ncbi:MAG: hypothetical protein GY778_31130 [bacterium]|nr:hypothetical protein [bacterium]